MVLGGEVPVAHVREKQTVNLDIDNIETLENFSVEDIVEVTVKGTVKSISAPREFSDGDEFPGNVTIEVDSFKLKGGGNTFSELDEQAEED